MRIALIIALTGGAVFCQTNPAESRLSALYRQLGSIGVKTGAGNLAREPILVNGKPVVALIVGDWHEEQYQKRASALIPAIARGLKIPTLILEGGSADLESEALATVRIRKFEAEALKNVLTGAERASITGGGSTNYNSGDYRTLVSAAGYPARWEGMESRDSEEIYYQMLRIYHSVVVEMIAAELLRETGRFVISVGGRPYNDGRAVLIAAERELGLRYGPDFPRFIVPLETPNEMTAVAEVQKPAVILTTAKHRTAFMEYFKLYRKYWVAHDLRPRNFGFAQRIQDFFRRQEARPAGQREDLVIVVAGAAHLVSLAEVSVSPPSLLDLLPYLGVTAGSIYALEEGESLENSVDPESGTANSAIVKRPQNR